MEIREVTISDLDRCYEIESVSYAGDEAATKPKIQKRIETYPEGFIVLEVNDEVVGFINSGAAHKVQLSDEEFKELVGHDPAGKNIVIMSVVVHPDHQGKGYSSLLLNEFTKKMQKLGKSKIFLICKSELVALYSKHGFKDLGESDSDHGGLSWHEMALDL